MILLLSGQYVRITTDFWSVFYKEIGRRVVGSTLWLEIDAISTEHPHSAKGKPFHGLSTAIFNLPPTNQKQSRNYFINNP